MELFLIKTKDNGLQPTPECRDDYESLQISKKSKDPDQEDQVVVYRAQVTCPRDAVLHRKIFALINIAYENQSQPGMHFNNREFFREELLKKAGHCVSYVNFKGITCYKAKSIAYDKLDNIQAKVVYNGLVDVVLQHVLIGSTKKDIETAIEVASHF